MTDPADDKEENGAKPEAANDVVAEVPAPAEPAPPVDPVAEAKAEAARFRDQLLRTAADFDNYRKRSRRDAEDAHRKGAEELLRAMLPVFDNLERAVLHADQSADAKAISDGVRMVLKQFGDVLGRLGIKRVGTVGESFDPLVHEAIQQVDTADKAPGTVVAEVAPGYQFGERLIRAALVVVARAPAATKPSEPPQN